MPNVIIALTTEMARVRATLPKLDASHRREAEMLLDFSRVQLGINCFEGMSESLEDLRQFGQALKKSATEGGSR
jgi:hypothetical protein